MFSRDWLITATPPTPNGDLHVGHMSGPYLAADIFRRARARFGDSSVYICYGDDNQSYVVTTAKRLNTDPESLMEESNGNIEATLDTYEIGMDQYSRPDDAHGKAVGDSIRLLVEKGLIVERDAVHLIGSESGQPLYEAFADGHCNACLAGTKGGICEACGHPNDPVNLIANDGRDNAAAFETTSQKRLVLPVENFRDELVDYYTDKRGRWRPHLLHLVDELLSEPLADYPVSHPSSWGIPIGMPGWDGHAINVWAEMGLGLLHALSRHRSADKIREGSYIQFLGYDNSYFFAIVHPVLQFAMKRAGIGSSKLPDFIFTNEFYHLENEKFSTSKGHAIWARDLLEHLSVDEARFYLSLHGPELAESNFELDAAIDSVAETLRDPLAQIHLTLASLAGMQLEAAGNADPLIRKLEARMRLFSEPEYFSSRQLAVLVQNTLFFLAGADMAGSDPATRRRYVGLVAFLIEGLTIFCPDLAASLAASLDNVREATTGLPHERRS